MMTTRRSKGFGLVAAIAITLVLVGAGSSRAGDEGKAEAADPGTEAAMMAKGMTGNSMMAMHEEMHAKMQAMDQKLESLVVAMNAAGGRQKTDAVAAVVTELVSQRKAMQGMMMKTMPQMMGHMAECMRSGMMAGMEEGMKQSMGDCPMMKMMQKEMPANDEPAEADDHSAHHPEG